MIVVFTGPESTGKSTLSQALADHTRWPLFPELARGLLESRTSDHGPRYWPRDLLWLLSQQQDLERNLPEASHCILDTDLLTLLIWWQEKYGPAPEVFQRAWQDQAPRHYVLCEADLPWEADPLRENPHDRGQLFELYQHELIQRRCSFSVCSGDGQQRLESVLRQISATTNLSL